MNHSSTAQNENVVFNNSMRDNSFRNDLFYRQSNSNSITNDVKSRIWINLISPNSNSSSTLVGYTSSATNSIDRLYDANALGIKADFELYSICNNQRLSIQGKDSFTETDITSLGYKADQDGLYTIAINTVDGLFSNTSQNIYLEDLSLGITHDLRNTPYSFSTESGVFDNRFKLKYTNSTLNNEEFYNDEGLIKIYSSSNSLIFDSNDKNIKEIKIYDVLGKTLYENNFNERSINISSVSKTNSSIFIKLRLEDNSIITKKLIF